MSVSSIGAGTYAPPVPPRVAAGARSPAPAVPAVDSDGDHDGSTASAGHVDLKL